MKQYDIKCPICGQWNRGLFLDETDGWMECENCHKESQSYAHRRERWVYIPILTMEQMKTLPSQKVSHAAT